MNIFCKAISITILSSISVASAAADITGSVLQVGCHMDKTTCFAYIDKDISSTCPINDRSLRWDAEATNGNEAMSILLSAEATGKHVKFILADTCYDNFPSFRVLHSI